MGKQSLKPRDKEGPDRNGISRRLDDGHGHHRDQGPGDDSHHASQESDKPFTDPVCGMKVGADPAREIQHEGQTCHFCSTKCMDKFRSAPRQYTGQAEQGAAAPDGTIYTCPMHPEIRQPQPGNCPICGMRLEPVLPSLEEEDNPELVDFKHRFWWTLPLTVVVAVQAMAGHRLFSGGLPGQSWIELALSTPVVLWAGWLFSCAGCWASRRRRRTASIPTAPKKIFP
jgi:Cu+-exporting ATPase